ncbi:hypothetical protein COT42_01075 [Candidatus Saganbacteria bacterium CG08_land_8_20_14_0_20_45_16]|uniref:Uncharacterized protein n=1 Tax=Candidatus Saganbacteria bacterium CG08_land_8_20_14_0_20_45_16 TaxID=2014293 RepID=A0A2H0Y236_UNCSA|nr:MAG: hypothetical protein COT42_01075 [Candidatus Saganbacteria bacterium CG08_land_8_20_14_0_20_45_16]
MFEKIKITRIDLRQGSEELLDKVVIEIPLTIYNYRDFSSCQPIKTKINVEPKIILSLMAEFQKKIPCF